MKIGSLCASSLFAGIEQAIARAWLFTNKIKEEDDTDYRAIA